jgi:uncharacterized protein YcbX
MGPPAKLQAIYRYPVKGLSAEPLQRAELSVGETVAGDRIYAVENGPTGFDPAAPRYMPKQRYLMLMRNVNLGTVAAVETAVGAPVDPLRFRANLYVAGWPAWREFDLVDSEIAIGNSVRLKIVKRIVRCAATEVDPDTGIRDLQIPRTLMKAYGHADCGIYGEVIAGGTVAVGDSVTA